MPGYLLGIDIGTGSTKAIAITPQGEILFSTSATYPTLQPQPGHSEQNPELIWDAFVTCVRTTVSRLGNPMALSLSSAMHGVLSLDRHNNPLTNLILWSDNRSAAIAERIKNSASGEMLYEQCGTPIHAMSPLCKIIWIKENDRETFNNTAHFVSIKEYIWFRVFNAFEVDHSLASATGLFDIEDLRWNENALSLCEIRSDQLSTPVSTGYSRKKISPERARELSLDPTTCFVIGASDGCLANLGTHATHPGVAALTIGTSGAIRVSRQKPVFNFESMPFNYRLDESTFISGGPVNNGGIALKWYAENFLGQPLSSPDDYQKLLGPILTVEPGADGIVFLPYILGERAPLWNSEACGVFFGMSARHHQHHLTRAVVEGVSMALYHVAQALEKNEPIKQINVSGGFVRSAAWLQILADIFGKPLALVHADDASAIGACYLALRTLGIIRQFEEMNTAESTMIYPNNERHRAYSEHVFPKYQRLYTLLKSEMTLPVGRKTPNLTTPLT